MAKKKSKKSSAPKASAKSKAAKSRSGASGVGPMVHYTPEKHPSHIGAAAHIRKRSSSQVCGLSKNQLLDIYRYLFETRRLEEHLVALYRQSQVIGGVYRSLGQEATAVGCTYALRDGDIIQPLIRDMGATLVHGCSPLAILRQYMARELGPSGGRDLNSHFSAPHLGLLGPVSMLGSMIPPLAGCLLAARMKGEKKVGMAFIGDGGSSTAAFYEGVNFAAVQKLPMIVVIEANHYAYSTPTSKQLPDGDLIRRAKGFGTPVTHVDGNDVLACYEAAQKARAYAAAGFGTSILVADTYRRKGHAEHDDQRYIDKAEPLDWQNHNDPVNRYEQFLLDGKHAGAADIEAINAEVNKALDADRDLAVSESFPDPATLKGGVFADGESPWPAPETWWRGGPRFREGAKS